MGSLLKFFTSTSVFLGIFNMFSGIIAVVWLVFLGEWAPIGVGFLIMLVSRFILGLALAPGMLLAAPLAHFASKGSSLEAIFFWLLSSLYTVMIMSIWCTGIIFYFLKISNQSSLIAMLIWSYSVALGPFQYMASKESGDSINTFVSVYFLQIAYILGIVGFTLFDSTTAQFMRFFGVVMFISLVIQLFIARMIIKEQGNF